MKVLRKNKTVAWDMRAININKNVSLEKHIFAVLISMIIGIVVFSIVDLFLIPNSMPIPKTTAITWLVENKHSMQLDYIRFFLFIFIVTISIVLGWLFLIPLREIPRSLERGIQS